VKLFAVMSILLVLAAAAGFAQGYDALVREAEAKLAAKDWSAALALYEKAFATGEFSYSDYYNAACASARIGELDRGYSYLMKAIDAGYLDVDGLTEDPDLESLRAGKGWPAIMDAVRAEGEAMERSFPETRPAGLVIALPAPRLDGAVSVEAALKNRRSIRTYADKPLTIAEVSQLLWAAYGITKPMPDGPAFVRGGFRTAPSAGARYPLDLYLVALNVEGLPPGVYWYRSETHELVRVIEGDTRKELGAAAFDQMMFKTAAAAIVYSAVFERNTSKYGRRGRERYVSMDLGHSAENVYLEAYALKIGTCAVGAFTDLWLKKAVGMTRAEEPLYIMPLGKVE
jgi:SagB-type dehydrogenase family enzyme